MFCNNGFKISLWKICSDFEIAKKILIGLPRGPGENIVTWYEIEEQEVIAK